MLLKVMIQQQLERVLEIGISKMIKEMSDCKVVFNGDGSDEVLRWIYVFSCCS